MFEVQQGPGAEEVAKRAGCDALVAELERELGSWVFKPGLPFSDLASLVRSTREAGSQFSECSKGKDRIVNVTLQSGNGGLTEFRIRSPEHLFSTGTVT